MCPSASLHLRLPYFPKALSVILAGILSFRQPKGYTLLFFQKRWLQVHKHSFNNTLHEWKHFIIETGWYVDSRQKERTEKKTEQNACAFIQSRKSALATALELLTMTNWSVLETQASTRACLCVHSSFLQEQFVGRERECAFGAP